MTALDEAMNGLVGSVLLNLHDQVAVEKATIRALLAAARADALAEIRAGVEGLMKDARRSYDDAVARSLPVLVDRPVEARLWSARMNGLDSVLALLDPPK